MDDQELRKLIEQLHAEIQAAHTVDKKDQDLLVHLDTDIHELLNRSGENSGPALSTTIRRLEEGLDAFEITHPTLTNLISELLELLSNAGI